LERTIARRPHGGPAGSKFPNPRRFASPRGASYADGVNFGVLKVDTLADPPRVELRIADVNGKTVIRQTLTIRGD
jgi:hypothetical protein